MFFLAFLTFSIGKLEMPAHKPIEMYFWKKVKKGHGCWLWAGLVSPQGYGRIGVYHRGMQQAHRMAWELCYGPIPEGVSVLHKCGVRGCSRPNHLYLGTAKENARDMAINESTNTTRLTATDIPLIKTLSKRGWTLQKLARFFGVTYQNIRRILHEETWRHIS